MSENKKMTPELIAILSKYEDRFRRALRGERVELSSIGIKELEKAHLELFGTRQSMTQCCGGSRNTSERISPLAKAYFKQINGSEKKTTGLAESLTPPGETETPRDSIESKEPEPTAPPKKKAVKQPENS